MKAKIILAAVVMAAMSAVSCADLGFGVDVDSGGVSPYWYGNGGFDGGGLWDSPYWNYGPYYNGPVYGRPVLPPFIDTNPGPVIRPPHQRPPQINVNPGINGVPGNVGGVMRPGNGGRPTVNLPPTPAETPTNGASNNNARR